jgi:hypothetical protein
MHNWSALSVQSLWSLHCSIRVVVFLEFVIPPFPACMCGCSCKSVWRQYHAIRMHPSSCLRCSHVSFTSWSRSNVQQLNSASASASKRFRWCPWGLGDLKGIDMINPLQVKILQIHSNPLWSLLLKYNCVVSSIRSVFWSNWLEHAILTWYQSFRVQILVNAAVLK